LRRLVLTTQLFAQKLVGQLGVSPSAGFLHHLPDKEALELGFTIAILF
jgi:hypothetical protein